MNAHIAVNTKSVENDLVTVVPWHATGKPTSVKKKKYLFRTKSEMEWRQKMGLGSMLVSVYQLPASLHTNILYLALLELTGEFILESVLTNVLTHSVAKALFTKRY